MQLIENKEKVAKSQQKLFELEITENSYRAAESPRGSIVEVEVEAESQGESKAAQQ